MLNKVLLNLPLGACVAAMALLSACGGDDADAVAAPPSGVFSAQNEATLSSAVVHEIASIQAVGGLTQTVSPGVGGIASASVKRAMDAATRARKAGALAAESFTIDCTDGGTVALELADDLSSFSASFAACTEGGQAIDGSLSVVTVSASADGLKLVADVKVDLVVTQGTAIDKLRGDMRLSLDGSTAGQKTETISSALQSFEHSVDGQVLASRTLRNLLTNSVVADSGERVDSFAFTSEGTLPLLEAAAFKVETITALTTPAGATDPVSGQIKATVGGKGIILLTAEATTVHVQADAEGDGTFEIDRRQTWSSLADAL